MVTALVARAAVVARVEVARAEVGRAEVGRVAAAAQAKELAAQQREGALAGYRPHRRSLRRWRGRGPSAAAPAAPRIQLAHRHLRRSPRRGRRRGHRSSQRAHRRRPPPSQRRRSWKTVVLRAVAERLAEVGYPAEGGCPAEGGRRAMQAGGSVAGNRLFLLRKCPRQPAVAQVAVDGREAERAAAGARHASSGVAAERR